MKGTVKWYNSRKGYGFIQVEGGDDVFVHRSDVPADMDLQEGDAIKYDVEQVEKGLKAVNLKKI